MDCTTDWWNFGEKSEQVIHTGILFKEKRSTIVWSYIEIGDGEK